MEGGFEEAPVFKKKTKIGYSVLGLRKPNLKTKNIPFEKSHNAEIGKGKPCQIF